MGAREHLHEDDRHALVYISLIAPKNPMRDPINGGDSIKLKKMFAGLAPSPLGVRGCSRIINP